MGRKPLAAFAATFFVAATIGASGIQAEQPRLAPTVILACDQGGDNELVTRVPGSETAGAVPERLAAALQAEPSCAQAFSLLAQGGFALVHRVAGSPGEFDGDGDVDGRDFLVWQRSNAPAPARPSARSTTVLMRCGYTVAGATLTTQVVGSEVAGPMTASLAAVLASQPSCAEAHASLGGAGFVLLSAARAAATADTDAQDFLMWQRD
jgi:hypothetical protein